MHVRCAVAFACALLHVAAAASAEEPGARSPAPAPPSTAPDPTSPGLLGEAPALSASTAARATPRLTAEGTLESGAMATVAPGVALSTATQGSDAVGLPVAPTVGASVQLLRQARAGLDATATVRYRALGPELAGPTVDARLAVGRTFGAVLLATNAVVSQGVGLRRDVDLEATATAAVRASSVVVVGAEARVRGEVTETYLTAEDVGRPLDVVAGATASVAVTRTGFVKSLAGWAWPRGPVPPGPAALVAAGVAF